ncbi:hypothetical protein CDL15_Pgr024697 [Punica granatum]|uniref:Uncharacterized protein n=2 Tax=Punica granatum TaxID=22663 RepID=A0A218W6A3_PUNGR|nr:hypothetical protein CDL15_Pgr024697 [Punica granatum]
MAARMTFFLTPSKSGVKVCDFPTELRRLLGLATSLQGAEYRQVAEKAEARLEAVAVYKRSTEFQDLVEENNSEPIMEFAKAVMGEIKEKNPEVNISEYETFQIVYIFLDFSGIPPFPLHQIGSLEPQSGEAQGLREASAGTEPLTLLVFLTVLDDSHRPFIPSSYVAPPLLASAEPTILSKKRMTQSLFRAKTLCELL